MRDKMITCVQCDQEFVFSAEQRRRYQERGFDEPSRCPVCRKKKSKDVKLDGPWKDKGRKKHGGRKKRRDFDDEM